MENLSAPAILFVLNKKSGNKKKNNIESLIKNYFKNLPHTVEFYNLTGKDDTVSIHHLVNALHITKVVAVGGDGTINFIARQLLGTKILLGIIPAGSANGTAKELGLPESVGDALDIIVNGKVKCCDVIQINEKDISLHLSDLGLNARLIKYFEESSLRGMYGYARMLAKVLWYKKLMSAHIITDNANFKTNAYMIVIANASKYGTGAVINPDGNTGDGVFEIAVVRRVSILNIMKMFFKNPSLYPKQVQIFKTKKAVITTKKATHFQVDGEYKGKLEEVTAEIIHSQLHVLVKSS